MASVDSYGASVPMHTNVKELQTKWPFFHREFNFNPSPIVPLSLSSYVTNWLSFSINICVLLWKDEKSYLD